MGQVGVWQQIIVALELGLYHHTDYLITVPAEQTLRFNVFPPDDFYGMVMHALKYGDVLPNVFDVTAFHRNWETGTKRIHSGNIDIVHQPWTWITRDAPLYFEITNFTVNNHTFQATGWEIYFGTKDAMELAHLALWEMTAPNTYALAVSKGIIPAYGDVRILG